MSAVPAVVAATPPRRPVARLAWGLALLAVVALLAACSTITGLDDTRSALESDGFTEVNLDFDSTDGHDSIDVTLNPELLDGDPEELLQRGAETVWDTFPLAFDELSVTLAGAYDGYSASYSYRELQELFGPRPPGFDERSVGDDVTRTGLVAAVVVGFALLVFVAVAVLVIVLAVRASRRRAAATPPPWPPGAGSAPSPSAPPWPPQAGAQPPPPTGWGSQPPAPPPPSGGAGGPSWPPPPQ